MNGEDNKPAEYVKGVLIKEFSTKYGPAISMRFVNEEAFLEFFISKIGIYKGGLKLTAYRKAIPTEHTTHSLRVSDFKPTPKDDIESDFAKPSEDHTDKIDELPF
jgi:hypothetical protein